MLTETLNLKMKEVVNMMLFNNPTSDWAERNIKENTFEEYYRYGKIHYVFNYMIGGLHFTEYILVKEKPCKFLLCEGHVIAYQRYEFVDKG